MRDICPALRLPCSPSFCFFFVFLLSFVLAVAFRPPPPLLSFSVLRLGRIWVGCFVCFLFLFFFFFFWGGGGSVYGSVTVALAERSIDLFVPPTPDSTPPARTQRSGSRSPKGSGLAPKSRTLTPNPPRFVSSAANRSSKPLTANSCTCLRRALAARVQSVSRLAAR